MGVINRALIYFLVTVKDKMRVRQLNLLLICLFQKSFQNCFTLECSLKISDKREGKIVDEWEYKTCGHNLSCQQANDRVYSRCRMYPNILCTQIASRMA